MTDKEYRQHEGISRSELWQLRESPEKFKYVQEHPEPPTPALIFGQVVHKLLLEPDTFDNEFIIWDNSIKKTTTAGKDAWKKFEQSIGDKTVINMYDSGQTLGYLAALNMATKAKEIPFVEKLLNGEHEKPLFWTDEMTGEACKVRLDCLTEVGGNPLIVDYKTTTDASTDSFIRSAVKLGYDFQAAMYCEAVEKTTGKKPTFVFIAQEKTAPYAVNILQADEVFIKRGRDIFRELLGTYKDCKQSGNWWGYLGAYNVINNLGLPAWLAKEVE